MSSIKKLISKALKEAPIDYEGPERMSGDIERKLRSREHPLGGNPGFPDIDRSGIPDNFEELIASKRFKDVVEKVKAATGLERIDPMTFMSIQPMFMRAVSEVISIEREHKEELEKLAVELVVSELGVPEGDLQFDAKLEKPNMEGMSREPQKPKKNQDFENPQEEMEAAERLEKFDLERQKRRFINSLIQGSSKKALYLYYMVEERLNELDPRLLNLYSLVMSVNDLLYWVIPNLDQMMSMPGGGEESMGGREELNLETDPPTIIARGMMFPILVHELFKGVMDYVSAHGLPSDPDTAEAVVGMEDTLPAEVWDLRLGPVIWEKFTEAYPSELFDSDKRTIQNYLYFKIISLEPEDFFTLTREMLSGTQKGKDMVKEIVDGIIRELQREEYEDVMGGDDEGGELGVTGPDEPITPQPRQTSGLDLDSILDKISRSGIDSLTPDERRFLDNI